MQWALGCNNAAVTLATALHRLARSAHRRLRTLLARQRQRLNICCRKVVAQRCSRREVGRAADRRQRAAPWHAPSTFLTSRGFSGQAERDAPPANSSAASANLRSRSGQ